MYTIHNANTVHLNMMGGEKSLEGWLGSECLNPVGGVGLCSWAVAQLQQGGRPDVV